MKTKQVFPSASKRLKKAWKNSGDQTRSLKQWCQWCYAHSLDASFDVEAISHWIHNKRADASKPQLKIGRTSKSKNAGKKN